MARMSIKCSATLVALMVMIFLVSFSYAGGEGSVPVAECPGECSRRCSKASQHESCLSFCNICCEKCLCVPSGTAGNKEECPCYNNWKTKKGKSKCP